MSRERLAAAYEELAALHGRVAEQYAQVAHELMGTPELPAPIARPSPPLPDPTRPDTTANASCPQHGAARVKQNRRGLYCATKVGDGWCDWSAAA
jgi:hypothetical protein